MVEKLGVGVTFHPNDEDRTFTLLLQRLAEYGDDLSGSDQTSVSERKNLRQQLTALYVQWQKDIEAKKSDAEELASYVNAVIRQKFRDDEGTYYAVIEIDNHRNTLDMDSADFKSFVSRISYDTLKRVVPNEKRDLAIRHLKDYTQDRRTMYNRVAYVDGAIYIDLHTEEWRAVKITKDAWHVVENPLLFRRKINNPKLYSMPAPNKDYDRTRRYLAEILKGTTIQFEHQRRIAEIYIVSLFIQHIAHPLILPYGAKGAGKSTLMRMIKLIADPTATDDALLRKMPTDERDRHVGIFFDYMTYWDNVSFLKVEEMDELCQWVTGYSKVVRVLNTTDERREYIGRRIVGMNGVNMPVSKSDILDRCFIIDMARMEEGIDERAGIRLESEVIGVVRALHRDILGYICDVLMKALALYESEGREIRPNHRLADFVVWGELISRALGNPKGLFLKDWKLNVETQSMTVIANDSLATLFVRYAYNKRVTESGFELQPAEMLRELRLYADEIGMDYHTDKQFPKNEVWLTRRLAQIEPDLLFVGITVQQQKGQERKIRVIKDMDQYKAFQEKEQLRRQAEQKVQEDEDRKKEEALIKKGEYYFTSYCNEYEVDKARPIDLQSHFTIHGFGDTGKARYVIDKMKEMNKLVEDDEGNLVAGPNFEQQVKLP